MLISTQQAFGMITTIQYPFPLLLITAIFALGATADNHKFLRGRRTLDDIFSVAALHVHDTSISSPVPPVSRRARDDLLNDWVQQCSTFLTSQNVVADGVISQNEFVDFMVMQCHAEDVCPKKMNLKFEQLDLNVQLKFISGICYHEDFADRSNCIYDLHDQWLENNTFGFKIDDEGDNTQSLIHSMCTEVYIDVVRMGFTRTTELTSSPSTTKMPSSVPTLNPSRSSIPSTSPSNHPISSVPATFAPTTPAEKPSSAPMSTASTNSESQGGGALSHREFQSPSSMPSVTVLPPGKPAIDVDAKPPLNTKEDHDSLSRDTIIVAAAVVILVIAGSVYTLYNHPPRTVTTKTTTFSNPIHDVPLACLGLNQSISSSSCSFQDHRFINVYSSEGSPIPQFNPSTASKVVIGTVTIGGSSYSSSFCEHDQAHDKANSRESENGRASSLISGRTFHLVTRKNAKFRHRYTKKQALSRGHDGSPSSRSVHSCKTIPMTLTRGETLHSHDRSDERNTSLGDWKAVSYMSSELCCGSPATSATAAAAAAKQNRFFFELFTADNTLERTSCHSLPVIPRQFSFGSSDAGASSVLSESFFQDPSYIQNQSIAISLQSPASAPNTDTAPSNVLVPWRKSGFSRDVEFSDDSRSDRSGSDLSDSYVAPPIRNKRGFFNSKRLFTAFSKKTKAKFSFRNRQYQYLRGVELHEDPSVLSLSNSYSSQTKLMAQQLGQTPTNQPTASLGTFAAATLPFRPESVVPLEAGNEPTLEARSPQSPSNCVDQTGVVKSDSASAFSRSQFESSKGWSSCSRSSSSSDSSSDGSQWHNADLNGSFAEAIAIDGVVPSHTADIDVKGKIDLSRISSKSDSSESLEVSESSEVPEEEQSESFIGTVHNMGTGSLAFSSSEDDIGHYASLLPHVVSHSSDEMSFLSFPSDEMTSVLTAMEDEVKTPQLQRVVPNDDDSDECSVEPASSNACAENVIAWAITNEMKKLEGSIPL